MSYRLTGKKLPPLSVWQALVHRDTTIVFNIRDLHYQAPEKLEFQLIQKIKMNKTLTYHMLYAACGMPHIRTH